MSNKQKRIERAARRDWLKRAGLWLISIGLVLGIIALFYYFGNRDINLGEYSLDEVAEFEWTKGSEEASVILVKYSDFECPACGAYYPLAKQLAEEFEDDLLFVYRHFPLGIFRNSELAAMASEAAGQQGMFWEMHDIIFDAQSEWSGRLDARDLFVSYADEIGLDVEQFETDLNNNDLLNKIRSDRQSGLRARVNSTPTFFLNGERIQNPQSYEAFRNLIIGAME